MNKYKNNIIWIFMNINVNKRNKTKLVEKLMWHTNKITSTPAANYPRLQDLVPNKCWDIAKWLNIRIIYLNTHKY